LGWAGSLGVGLDGRLWRPRRELCGRLGRLGQGDTIELRLAAAQAYFRLWPDGAWNGEGRANPDRREGGIDLPSQRPVFPAVYLEQPDTRVLLALAHRRAAPVACSPPHPSSDDPRGINPDLGVQP